MIQRLFVYGTLAPGAPNAHVMSDIEGQWEPASVRGFLVQEGWAVEHGYPAISLDAEAPEVEGLVFASEHLDEHWVRLDDFEGVGYDRVTVVAETAGGSVEAQVYVHRQA